VIILKIDSNAVNSILGGTADISVHEKLPNGKLKAIHKASGGP